MSCFLHVVLSLGLLILASMGLSGCSAMQTLPRQNISVGELQRAYYLYVPSTQHRSPLALIVAFHGGGGMGETFPQQKRFEALAESNGIILAFPQGYSYPGNEGEWQLNTQPDAAHDINFIGAMIDEIASRHAIDRNRIYATGYSLGSMFTYEVACNMSDRFAAFSSFAGTMPIAPAQCKPEHSRPIMHIHGRDDPIISYSNTWGWKAWDEVGRMMDIPSLVQYWRNKHACRSEDIYKTNGTTHFVYSNCKQNTRVEHHRVDGTGHAWPDEINGRSTHQVIWSFFRDFTL